MRLHRRAVERDGRARRADIAGGPHLAGGRPAKQLGLHRDRIGLVQRHGLGRLAVQHDAGVADRPGGHARRRAAQDPVHQSQPVAGERDLVDQVGELVGELAAVVVVGDPERPVLHHEGVVPVLAGRPVIDLGNPAVEVAAVEDRDPAVGGAGGRRLSQDDGGRRDRPQPPHSAHARPICDRGTQPLYGPGTGSYRTALVAPSCEVK